MSGSLFYTLYAKWDYIKKYNVPHTRTSYIYAQEYNSLGCQQPPRWYHNVYSVHKFKAETLSVYACRNTVSTFSHSQAVCRTFFYCFFMPLLLIFLHDSTHFFVAALIPARSLHVVVNDTIIRIQYSHIRNSLTLSFGLHAYEYCGSMLPLTANH